MLYDVSLVISYDYARPAAAGRHSLHLMPPEVPGEQRLVAAHISIDPEPSERSDRQDFFGNSVTDIQFHEPHNRLQFELHARIDRSAASVPMDLSPPLHALEDEIASVRSLGPQEPVHYLSDSPRLPMHKDFVDYAQAQVGDGMTAMAAVEAIGAALNKDMVFDSQATSVETPALEAFERRHGVCQDFSHIMIACLRGIGIPAGYVSGFLRTYPPEGEARLEGADAMHAWVRAWCGIEVGWIEYDPTNALRVAQDHIVVAHGRDYGDVAPVKGILRTSGGQSTGHKVDVVPLQN